MPAVSDAAASLAPRRPASPRDRTSGRPDEEPEPAEEADASGLEQRPEPLVVEDVRGDDTRVRVDDARAESLSEERLPPPLLEAGPRSASRPLPLARRSLLLGDEAAGREERLLDRAERAREHELDDDQRDEERAGQRRSVSRGRSQRKTSATTTNITMPVRETVDAQAAASTNAQSIQRRCR